MTPSFYALLGLNDPRCINITLLRKLAHKEGSLHHPPEAGLGGDLRHLPLLVVHVRLCEGDLHSGVRVRQIQQLQADLGEA